MIDFFEQLLDPFVQFFVSFIDLVIHIPNLLLSLLRLLVNATSYFVSFGTNFVNAINFLVVAYDTVYSILVYMPSPIVTLVVLGLGVISVRLVLDFF